MKSVRIKVGREVKEAGPEKHGRECSVSSGGGGWERTWGGASAASM